MIGTTIAEIDDWIDAQIAAEGGGHEPSIGLLQEGEELAVGPKCLLSPTVSKFVECEDDVQIIVGPRREGKSVGAIAKCIYWARKYPEACPLTVAIVRDTHKNLTRSTIKTLKDGARDGWWDLELRDQDTVAILDGGRVYCDLFGMDRPADANKFQSYQCDIVLIEEPAPAADMSSGVPIEVFAMGMSSLSNPKCKPIMLLPMNPSDDDHWTVTLADWILEHGGDKLTVKTFWIPPGENRHVSDAYRVRMRLALEAAGRPDLVRRLVEGQTGTVQEGEAVTPEFVNAAFGHVPDQVEMNPRWLSYRFWDFGLNPTCVWCQQTPSGHLNALGAVVGKNMGIEQMIPRFVLPWQGRFGMVTSRGTPSTAFGRARRPEWVFRDIGDPNGVKRSEDNSDRSAAWALERMLGTTFEQGPSDWGWRRDSVKWVLTQVRGAGRMAQFDKAECQPLIRALSGRWRYLRTSAGKVSALPIKDEHSHPGDAYSHGVGLLFPAHEMLQRALDDRDRPPAPPRPKRPSWLSR